MSVGVLCAVHGPDEGEVVRALDSDPGLRVVRRCADIAELLAASAAGLGRVAVVSADLPGLDRPAVRELDEHGVLVVAVGAPSDAARLGSLGIGAVLRTGATGQDVVALVGRVLEEASVAPTGPEGREHRPTDEHGGEASPGHVGSVLAVWGPTGAPGRTTLAVNLAVELAAAGHPTLLADADTYGGAVAQLLGMLDEAPGMAAAARVAGQGMLDDVTLARLAPELLPGLRVLSGMTRADRWPELPGASLDLVWEVGRRCARWTVVDCGFGIERDEVLSYDTRAPQRNGATLSALAAADVVLVVGAADPVGVHRLVRALDELRAAEVLAPGALVRVVLNRVRASSVGPRPERLLRDALHRYAGVDELVFVPEDRAAVDAAVLRGQALREHAAGSGVRKAIARLAADVVARGHTTSRARVPAGHPA